MAAGHHEVDNTAPDPQASFSGLPPEMLAQMIGMPPQGRSVEAELAQVNKRDPKKEGRDMIQQIEKDLLAASFGNKRLDQLTDAEEQLFKRDMEQRLARDLKEQLHANIDQARVVENTIEASPNGVIDIPNILRAEKDITRNVYATALAMERGYIQPPDHAPTKALFNELAHELVPIVNSQSSPYLHPLLEGMLNESEYVKFSAGDDLDTRFEKDLKEILAVKGNQQVKELITRKLRDLIDAKRIVGITLEQLARKFDKAKQTKELEIEEYKKQEVKLREEAQRERRRLERENQQRYMGQRLEGEIEDLLDTEGQQDGIDGEQAKEALKLFQSLKTAEDFFKYYKDLYERTMPETLAARQGGPSSFEAITDPEERESVRERNAKNTTERMHLLLMYITHIIYTPVLEGDPHKNWQELIRAASGPFGVNPEMLFNNIKQKFAFIVSQAPTMPGEREHEHSFYNFGLDEKNIFLKDGPGELQGGRMVRQKVTTPELKKMESFKEFLERMHLFLDTEESLLTASINSNNLLLTGKTEHESSFFQQAAHYAHHSLSSQRIDELYHLPFHELVHAAKIQISSYFKKQFAMNDWIKDPDLFYKAFQHGNDVQTKVLFNLIRNFAKKGTPEWAIRRAFFHARMHLSLISQEWHAYAGYGHADLTKEFEPTYKDPAMKNLETYRPWWLGEQWQVGDTLVQNMAFLPEPDRMARHETWIHEDVSAEGHEIFKNASRLGKLAGAGMRYFEHDDGSISMPNIFEFNSLKIGGVEQQGGWRFKYSSAPWLFDMINHLGYKNEKLVIDKDTAKPEEKTKYNHRNLEMGWKRLENLGVDVLKMYRDSWLTGDGDFLALEKQKDGTFKTEYDQEWKNFFGFLYKRYFSEGVGKEGFNISFKDSSYKDQTIKFSDINGAEDFWTKVVEPILHRQPPDGKKEEDPGGWNDRDREAKLKEIVNHALGVMAFERLPLDFVFMENPTRSQNGITLMKELQQQFIEASPTISVKDNATQVKEFETALEDILYVQGQARAESISQMNKFVQRQQDDAKSGGISDIQRTTYGESIGKLTETYSDVSLSEHRKDFKGYRIDEHLIEEYLTEKYARDPELHHELHSHDPEVVRKAKEHIHHAIEKAVKVYEFTRDRVMQTPDKNPLLMSEDALEKVISDDRIKREMKYREIHKQDAEKFKKNYIAEMKKKFDAKSQGLQTRITWSENELLGGQLGIGLNDVAYPFLSFSAAGPDMVSRTIEQIRDTQEVISKYIASDMLSDLKKYYRKEDKEAFFDNVNKIRTSLKGWVGPADYDGTAMRFYENAINVMRLNSDAEDNIVELAYMSKHRPRSAMSNIVKEGPEFPLRRDDRYTFITDALHYAQFPKRAKSEDMIFEIEPGVAPEEWLKKKWGAIGGQLGKIVGTIWGPTDAKLVRKRWKELSGEALREREFATILDIFVKFGGATYASLILAAFFVLAIKEGYEKAEEAQ